MSISMRPTPFEKFLIVATILLCLFVLNSCSCDWHVKRAKAKCGEVANEVVTVHDTVITNTVKSDTVFRYFQKDTVIIKEGKLTVKYFYHYNDSTVYLQGKCASDTIYKEIKVPIEKTVIKVDYFPKWLMFLLGGLVIVGIVYKIFFK
jgi:hypothetical protein